MPKSIGHLSSSSKSHSRRSLRKGTIAKSRMSGVQGNSTIFQGPLSVRATKRVIAPYVKARPKKRPLATIRKREENKYFSYYLKKKPSILMSDLTKFLTDSVDLLMVLNETSDVLRETIKASGSTVYMVDESLDEIYQVPNEITTERHRICWKIQAGTTVAAYVAFHKEFIMVDDIVEDERFPDGIGLADLTIQSVLCVPVVTPTDECLAVVELHRTTDLPPFKEKHLRLVVMCSGWVGSAIFQNQQRLALQRQQELNEYLLDLTKCYFADTMLLDKLITDIVNFAKTALSAEHGNFYVIKRKFDDLMAEVYEEGISPENNTTVLHKRNVPVKIEPGDLLGRVAFDKRTINIKNAALDERFNNEAAVRKNNYITKSVLCMPIMGVEEILGIITVINKKRGAFFSRTDEILFNTFTIYCAFALHYSRLYEKMMKTTNLNDIYIEMLTHHMKPCIHDYSSLMNNPDVSQLPQRFNFFDWYITENIEAMMPQLTIYMLNEIDRDIFVDMSQMVKFVLTVQKSYHNHPYHNFVHAFTVTHCMYNILKRNLDGFTVIEKKALIIAALCHDIDHLGVTNNFLDIINHNLAQLYEESILENHHYHVTMFIFKDLKLFSHTSVTPEMYKTIITEIRDAIIATDLSLYFRRRSKLYQLCMDNSFDWLDLEHRSLLKSIIMTTCDLSGQCKPFPIARKICDLVYKEFYVEGDREKNMGLCPLSIMDREKQNAIPSDQIQFLTIVVLPCTLLLTKILPNCSPLYKEAIGLRDSWQEILDAQGVKLWKQGAAGHDKAKKQISTLKL